MTFSQNLHDTQISQFHDALHHAQKCWLCFFKNVDGTFHSDTGNERRIMSTKLQYFLTNALATLTDSRGVGCVYVLQVDTRGLHVFRCDADNDWISALTERAPVVDSNDEIGRSILICPWYASLFPSKRAFPLNQSHYAIRSRLRTFLLTQGSKEVSNVCDDGGPRDYLYFIADLFFRMWCKRMTKTKRQTT